MKATVFLVLALTTVAVLAQKTEFKSKQEKAVKVSSSAPVTEKEAKAVFEKLVASVNKGLKFKPQMPFSFATGNAPISKTAILKSLIQIEAAYGPLYKRNPRAYKFDSKRVSAFVPPETNRLISRGFVAPYGPLTTGKNEGLTPKQFADSVGIFLVRLADLAHLPDSKYTPDLMPG